MRGLFTVQLRGRNLYVSVVHDKVDLLGTRGEVLDWELTADEWLDITKKAQNDGFNPEDWYYNDEREISRNIAIGCILEGLSDRLARGAKSSAEAFELIKAGGHTPGSQMVAVETAAGKAVLCGDIAYTMKNIRDRHPVGWYYHLGDTVLALDRALAVAARPDLAFPNHDTGVMQGRRVTRVA